MTDQNKTVSERAIADRSEVRQAIRKVLKHHKLTQVGDGVVEADIAYAVMEAAAMVMPPVDERETFAKWAYETYTANVRTKDSGEFADSTTAKMFCTWLEASRHAALSAGPTQAEVLTYTVDGEVMSPLEYIAYLHGELTTEKRKTLELQRVYSERGSQIGRLETALERALTTPAKAELTAQNDTGKLIAAADKHAQVYNDDDRQHIKTDVINAFYAGSVWHSAQTKKDE